MTSEAPAALRRREAVTEYFDAQAARWRDIYAREDFDARNFRLRAEHALALLARVRPRDDALLLDLGCGAGLQARAAARQGWRVIGADMTPAMLAMASSARDPHWLAAEADALPFADGSLDAAMMNGVLGYVMDPVRTLREVRRVLRPDGHLVISWASEGALLGKLGDWVSAGPDALYLALKQACTGVRHVPYEWKTSFYRTYLRYWNERDVCVLLREAGFRLVELRAVNYGQFRFMEKAVWPEFVDRALSVALEAVGRAPPLGVLRDHAKTHLALAASGG